MFWIEGVGRHGGNVALETLVAEAGRQIRPLEQLDEPLALGRVIRKRVSTDCSTWVRVGAQVFWQELGIAVLSPRDGQSVFQFMCDDRAYLAPASVVIAAMASPFRRIYPYLFKSQGLESFCTPLLGEESPAVGFVLPVSTVLGHWDRVPHGLLAKYSWIHSFPSAFTMFSSVYAAACNGELDIELPKANVTITLRSVTAGKYQLVTEMKVLAIDVQEDPFGFAAEHPRRIVVHESSAIDWKVRHFPVSGIPSRAGEWQLSNAEWDAIAHLFSGRGMTKYAPRRIVNLILEKLGSGRAWRKLEFGELNFPIVQATYKKLLDRGQWQELASTLTAMRSTGLCQSGAETVALPGMIQR